MNRRTSRFCCETAEGAEDRLLVREDRARPNARLNLDEFTDRLASAHFELPSDIVYEESIVLVNPVHPDARQITAKVVRKVEYDLLFRR